MFDYSYSPSTHLASVQEHAPFPASQVECVEWVRGLGRPACPQCGLHGVVHGEVVPRLLYVTHRDSTHIAQLGQLRYKQKQILQLLILLLGYMVRASNLVWASIF